MKDRIKMINEMSRSIQIVSIQIDIEDFEMVIHLFENIKLSFLAGHTKGSYPLCTFIRYSRVGCTFS